MADSPYNWPGTSEYPPTSTYAQPPGPIRTSGMAIAGFVCSLLGLVTCCGFILSLLGIVFGGVALGPTRRGEQAGAGLAIAAVVLGVVGILLGVAGWVIVATLPENVPVPGEQISESDRQWLESIGAVDKDETVQWFFSNGTFSRKEDGVVLTDRRVSVYHGPKVQSCEWSGIRAIELAAGNSWYEESVILIETDDDRVLHISVNPYNNTDRTLCELLEHAATRARHEAGKPAPASTVSPDAKVPAEAQSEW